MKKIIILSITLFFLTIVGLKAQEDSYSEPKYRFFNEYGIFAGSTWERVKDGLKRDGEFGVVGTFVNGIQINKAHFIGLGLGYEGGMTIGHGIPFFLNYRHFADKGHKLNPFMNVAMGARYGFWEVKSYELYKSGSGMVQQSGIGGYISLGGGFTSQAFSFTMSVFYRSRPREVVTGIEVKAGFTL